MDFYDEDESVIVICYYVEFLLMESLELSYEEVDEDEVFFFEIYVC